jgi:hypothetical protein
MNRMNDVARILRRHCQISVFGFAANVRGDLMTAKNLDLDTGKLSSWMVVEAH